MHITLLMNQIMDQFCFLIQIYNPYSLEKFLPVLATAFGHFILSPVQLLCVNIWEYFGHVCEKFIVSESEVLIFIPVSPCHTSNYRPMYEGVVRRQWWHRVRHWFTCAETSGATISLLLSPIPCNNFLVSGDFQITPIHPYTSTAVTI